MATQWSIDESAAALMTPFYKAVAPTRSLPGALLDAKLAVLKTRVRLGETDVFLSHPFFWAAFVLIGDGKSGGAPRKQHDTSPFRVGVHMNVRRRSCRECLVSLLQQFFGRKAHEEGDGDRLR